MMRLTQRDAGVPFGRHRVRRLVPSEGVGFELDGATIPMRV
jgi:hypothetical protein